MAEIASSAFGLLAMTRLMSYPRHVELQPVVDRREVELEVAVFLGVGRQLVRPDRDVAPLEATTDVPDLVEAGAPGREMVVLALRLGEPLAANPLEAAALWVVAVAAGEVQRADLRIHERAAALERILGARAVDVDLDRLPIGEVAQVDRHRDVLVALHQPVGAGRRLGVAEDELLDAEHLVEPRLPLRRAGRPGLERLRGVAMAGRAGEAGRRLALLVELVSLVDRPHGRIGGGIEVVARLHRLMA